MRNTRPAPTVRDAAAGVARRLRRTTVPAAVQVHDRELMELLSHVAARRHARAALAGAVAPSDAAVAASPATSAPQVTARPHEPAARPGDGPGTVLAVVPLAPDVRILRVARPAGFHFVPGQYVKLGVPGVGRNSYTIASAPDDPYLELCIEQRPGGRVSPRLFALRPGDRVELDARPKGSFALVASARAHLMVATVTGIAPFRSMLRHVAARGVWPGRFVVLHGASFVDELAYRAELEALAESSAGRLRYVPSVSRPADPRNAAFRGATGRVTELIARVVGELGSGAAGLQVYACGHPGMVGTVRREMAARRVPVAVESFG